MSSILDVPLSGGYVSTGDGARSRYDLEPGELTRMLGAYYRKHDPNQAWKIPGRALFGSAGSGAVKGIAICQFDEGGTDKLIAAVGTSIVAATPGATGTFSSLITGLNPSATRLTACHQDDRWHLGNGYDKNKVLMPDGTTRDMGMPTPQIKLTAATAATVGLQAFPTTSTGGFTNPALAYDGSGTSTYASGTLSAPGAITHTWSGWAANATAGRYLQLSFSLSGLPINNDAGSFGGTVGTGGTLDAGYNVTILLEKSEDGGGTWSTVVSMTRTNATPGFMSIGPAVAANSSLLQFRATLTYLSGTNAATLRIYAAYTIYGSTAPAFDTTGDLNYAYTWYNANEDNGTTRTGEGPPSDMVAVPAFTAQTMVTLTRTETAPTSATHWRIYRTAPGDANTIGKLGLLASVLIAETTYIDTFADAEGFLDPTIALSPPVGTLTVGDLSIPRDTEPPAFIVMTSWNGSVCGLSRTNPRALRYSVPGLGESFPEFYVTSSFPLPEHDRGVGLMPIGATMVVLCEGACLVVDDNPTVNQGEFNGADAKKLGGHPGCVGRYAYAPFSVYGEPRGAWVSPFGVYVTNGSTCECISTDLAWESEVNVPYLDSAVLAWDQKNLILWFQFDRDGDGLNDHEMPFHMARVHAKASGTPKLGQPTPKATSCMASALIGASHYRFSGHPSDGSIYIEDSGYADASTGENIAMRLKTGKITSKKVDLAIQKATVMHGEFGQGENATLTTTLYRDAANSSNSRENIVNLHGARGTTVFIGRAGEAVDFEIEYDGIGSGGILGIQVEVDGQGRSGSANRWVSTSATQ